MSWEVACIFCTEAMEPQLINNFAAVAFFVILSDIYSMHFVTFLLVGGCSTYK